MRKQLCRLVSVKLLALCLCAGCGTTPVKVGVASPTSSGALSAHQAGEACFATAEALDKKGLTAEAIAQYESARRHDPALNGTVARHLAVLFDHQNDAVRAQTEYQVALQTSPRDAQLLYDCGCFHLRQHHWPQADDILQRACAVDPDNQRYAFKLAIALTHDAKYREAYETFARVVGPASAHYNMGAILAEDHKVDAARQELNLALQEQPDLKQAQAYLQMLDHQPSGAETSTAAYRLP
jgi:tetratricopeptide (TPR) repeat protein